MPHESSPLLVIRECDLSTRSLTFTIDFPASRPPEVYFDTNVWLGMSDKAGAGSLPWACGERTRELTESAREFPKEFRPARPGRARREVRRRRADQVLKYDLDF